ncbi:MAG TPA: ABC transporter permease subunit, partial [Clostridia bacterium]|nr:ABC transporter permease subunit [Clostridia bacterium]
DLGATPTKVITKVILPLALPGIISGITMVFMPTLSTFVISDLLGNNLVQLLGNIINLEFTQNSWNYGSALSIILLLLMGITMLIEKKYNSKNQTAGGRIW